MVIPKSFEDVDDLEAMLLTSILGVLVALKEDLISYKQAESYWLSDFMADIFTQMRLSDNIVALLQESCELKELQGFTKQYYEKIDKLITDSKNLISQYYTEYEGYTDQYEDIDEDDDEENDDEWNTTSLIN
jgi:hypothetical protein